MDRDGQEICIFLVGLKSQLYANADLYTRLANCGDDIYELAESVLCSDVDENTTLLALGIKATLDGKEAEDE